MTTPRVALITGAGSARGIGFATATRLGSGGYEVVLSGHSNRVHQRCEELRSQGVIAHSVAGDLTESEGVQRLMQFVTEHIGRLDALVANHGMTSVLLPGDQTGEAGDIDHTSWEGFDRGLQRNLTSVFGVIKSAVPLLRQSSAGRIVVVSSVTGGTMAMEAEVAYAAAKAGVEGLVRAVALDEAPRGICVNAVAPGWIATESQTAHEASQGLNTPWGRSGSPEEVAAVISWLASPDASYLTGQVIVIDGGNSIREERSRSPVVQ